MGYKCRWCGEPLKFSTKTGWVHMDGKVYKHAPDGHDDHCVLPIRDEVEDQ